MWTMVTPSYLCRNKWAAMAASIWIQCTSGASYCFGVYSPLIKSSQSYDQSTLDSVAFFKDVGANIGVLSGFLYSCAGGANPMIVLSAGSIQCFAGYFMMWLSVTSTIPRPPSGLICFYMFLAAHSQTFFNTANVVTAVENFPDSRGTVVGIMKQAQNCLSELEQSPPTYMLDIMKPCLDTFVNEGILGHQDRDVGVLVAACICEITRITTPEAPYSDDVLRVFILCTFYIINCSLLL